MRFDSPANVWQAFFVEDFTGDFDLTKGEVWLNTAHQGALPRVAADEAREAISWKLHPWEMTTERFGSVPSRLRRILGRLIGAPAEEVILANSSSYGLHLLANGYPWRSGDEVLLVRDDFPSTILPWLGLERRGVSVRQIRPRGAVIGVEDLARNISPATRVFCTTWVHSFTGYAVDEGLLGSICRDRGVAFVLNASQGLGARPLDLSGMNVDALTCVGFKWLCGPYGTGFCWIRPALRESLEYNQAYWLAMQDADDLGTERELTIRKDLSARRYDIFGTANFFNFKAWTASLEYLLERGIDRVAGHDNHLVSRFLDGLDRRRFDLLSPRTGSSRSTLILVSHKDRDRNVAIHRTLKESGIFAALRRGTIRFSPHLYNTEGEIDRTLEMLSRI